MKHTILYTLPVALLLGCQAPEAPTDGTDNTPKTMSTTNDQKAGFISTIAHAATEEKG